MVALDDKLTTPIEYFYKWETETPNKVFLKQPYGTTWKELTYKETGIQARKLASGLRTLGLEKGSHIALTSKNCYHWVIADLAIMMAGCVSVPLYPSLDADQLSAVLEKSDSDAIIVGKVDKWNEAKDMAIGDRLKIVMPHYADNAVVEGGHSWDKLIEQSQPLQETHIPTLEEMWTIIFTSGTTGTPKGVVHTYMSPATVARNEELNNNLLVLSQPEARFFSFLPLNHIAERTAVENSALMAGGSLSFAENLTTFASNLQDTQPTFFFAVPRIWQKFQQKVNAQMPEKKLNRLLSIPFVSSIVKKKIKASLGLSKATCLITGASMTPESLKQWYMRLGLNLREGYGMTENMGAFCCMPGEGHKPNTVGKPISNTQCKIDPETGEILMKTPWTMQGYYKEPALSAETIKDGWMHSGDKGIIKDDGYVKIIGRVKDAFKTGKGEFIVPTTIEEKFGSIGHIDQVCVAGLGIPQPIALINLSEEGLKCNKDEVQKILQESLESVNKCLQGHEKLASIVVTKETWSDENKLLTPTLKIKRGSINERYGVHMQGWHDDKNSVVWEV
ncbi:MAG: long-chain acyl-CoA synthetase [Saprospiraceae bacterium]|jgi:long-chain acyl-CoA synthetase